MPRLDNSAQTKSDGELLVAIGQHKDREAFAQLFERYKDAGYSQAYRIIGNSELAKDAIQDALLSVWRSAPGFRPDGNARGWILKIIACKCLEVIRKEQRLVHKANRSEEALPRAKEHAEKSDKVSEQEEVIEKLRNLMGSLPREDHQLLTLYYGAGLSQAEVAEKLSMRARTVSRRIEMLLKSLRSRLEIEGFASALPLEWMERSVNGGWFAPEGLSVPDPTSAEFLANEDAPDPTPGQQDRPEEISPSNNAGSADTEQQASGREQGGTGMGKGVLLALCGVALFLAAGAAMFGLPFQTEQAKSGPNQRSVNFGPKDPQEWFWDFNSDASLELIPLKVGSWKRVNGQGRDGSDCMQVEPGKPCLIYVDVPSRDAPLEISFWSAKFDLIGIRREGAQISAQVHGRGRFVISPWSKYRFLVSDSGIDCAANGEPGLLELFAKKNKGKVNLLIGGSPAGTLIDDLRIRSVGDAEVSTWKPLIEFMKRVPDAKKSKSVLVPPALVPNAPQPVLMDFKGFEHSVPTFGPQGLSFSFDHPEDAVGFRVSDGSWRHDHDQDGNGLMEITSKRFFTMFRGKPSFPEALHISFRIRLKEKADRSLKARLLWGGVKKENGFLIVNRPQPIAADEWKTVHVYLSREISDLWVDHKRVSLVYMTEGLYNWLELYLEDGPYLIDDFTVKPIRETDCPSLEPLKDKLKKIPPRQRNGKAFLEKIRLRAAEK